MDKTRFSIATMTWARDEAEEKLLREALQQLALLEFPVFITDGGSKQSFLDFLRGVPNFIVLNSTTSGVWPQVHNSLMAAYDAGSTNVLYTEPDKRDFFKKGLPEMLEQFFLEESPGVVLAARSQEGFASFPAFQQMTETTINNCCGDVTGLNVDYTYGPFVLNRLVIPLLADLEESIGWGWRPFAFIMAHRKGYGLKTVEGDYFCPAEQQEENPAERVYRMRQLAQNIDAIVQGAKQQL